CNSTNLSKSILIQNKNHNLGVTYLTRAGSGKTTLLYTISGMDDATAGKIEFYGSELTSLTANEISDLRLKQMGFVFQQMYMLKNLSIYDNIVLPAYQAAGRHADRRQINDRARMLMAKLQISDVADNDISEVSGGQLQRACIARSMINNPKIIFADEPTGALNKQSSEEVMEELGRLNEEGTTMMIVTHDAKVASRCERILYIEDGNIRDEFRLGKFTKDSGRNREKELNDWLLKLGW
ncbi:MAG: ATP-binding cassette domain-containing protein, partial [Lachnospiraceae bacterium]|nr:ATP-binding cassette domain-containing protein [Lachnospiraceae bacterium]